MSWGRKYDLAAHVETFFNQDHIQSGENGGQFTGPNGGSDVSTSKVGKAFDALKSGKTVNLEQGKDLAKLVDKIGKSEPDPLKGPVFDLCKVNGFCAGTLGTPRADMPQLKTYQPVKGSKADHLPKDSKGQVDVGPLFLKSLRDKGIKVTTTTEGVNDLKPTQDEINGARVSQVLNKGGHVKGIVYVSRDDHIIDGHHHWAAAKIQGSTKMTVIKIDMSTKELLDYTNKFTKDYGIPHKAVGE